MDIKKTLMEYDSLLGHATPDEIHEFLTNRIRTADAEHDSRSLLTLLNEQIGYARDTDRRDIALKGCERLKDLLYAMNLMCTIPYANSMLNIANTSRKFGLFQQSLDAFQQAELSYRTNRGPKDYAFAGLYNNWSLLAMEQGQYEKAVELAQKAVAVTDLYEKAVIEQATSRINLSIALNDLASETGLTSYRKEAQTILYYAIELFEKDGGKDYHYSGALAALADMQINDGEYINAAKNYAQAIQIIRMYMGDNFTVKDLMAKEQFALTKAKEMEQI